MIAIYYRVVKESVTDDIAREKVKSVLPFVVADISEFPRDMKCTVWEKKFVDAEELHTIIASRGQPKLVNKFRRVANYRTCFVWSVKCKETVATHTNNVYSFDNL